MFKIFDEIIVNASDNAQKSKLPCDTIKIDFGSDSSGPWIKVYNNGDTLPIQVHKKHKVFVPELVFGHLLTSDNFDDTEKKVVGGRNGFGAKLCNVFSTKFEIECGDGKKRKMYKQTFSNNMHKKEKPKIKGYKGKNYTQVKFWPDLKRLHGGHSNKLE